MYLRHIREARLDRVVTLYLACKFVGALYFVYPIFYQFASHTITPVQVGLFFSITSLCNFIADIPSSIVADAYSRKAVTLAGVTLLTVAPLAVLYAHTFSGFILAAILYGAGGACMNGAMEALVYDHKQVSKATFRTVNALEMTCGQAGILVSAALGGVLFAANHTYPFVAQCVAGLVWLALILCIREENKTMHTAVVSYRRHLVQSVQHLLATPYLRVLVLMGVTFSVMLGMCIQFVNEAAMIRHGLTPTTRGLVISGAGIATIAILNTILLPTLKSDRIRIGYIGTGSLVAYACLGLGNLPLFLVGYLIWCCLNTTSSFIRLIIHDRIPGSHRATILSSFKALAVLIGLGGSTGTGLLVQQTHTPRAAYLLFSTLSLMVLVPCAAWLITHNANAE